MLYEDLIYLWLAFIIYEFIPAISFPYSVLYLILVFVFKEIFLFSFISVFKKLVTKFTVDVLLFWEKFFICLIFIFYALDLSIFNLKIYLEKIYFSSLISIFWFLHYYFIIKFFLFRLNINYFRVILGIIFPVLILIICEDLFDIVKFSFKGDILILLILVLLFSPMVIMKIWPLAPLKNLDLKKLILEIFEKNRIKIKEIYVLKDLGKKLYTAGIVGFIPPFRYLFFSKPLLEILNIEEILGVICHEIGHIKNKHHFWLLLILFNLPLSLLTIFILFYFIISLLSLDLLNTFKNIQTLSLEAEMILGFLLIVLSFIYIRYIFAYFLRQFEREADLYSFLILKDPKFLISALFKIGELTGQTYKKSWHHYGIFERIEFLHKISLDNMALEKFRKKLTKIRLFLIGWIIFNFLFILGGSFFIKID